MENNNTQDTQPQQPVVEEAPAAPQQATEEAQAATSEVHDIPPQEQQGIAVGESDPSSPEGEPVSEAAVSGPAEEPARDDMLGIGIEDISADPSVSDPFGNDNVSPTVEPFDLGSIEDMFEIVDEEEFYEGDANIPLEDDWSWDSEPSGTEVVSEELPPEAVSMPVDKIVKPVPTDQAQTPDSEAAAPLSPEAVSMPADKIAKPVPTDQGEELPSDSGEEGMDRDPNVYDLGITPDETYEILEDRSDEHDPDYGPDDKPARDDMLGISIEDIEGPPSDTDGEATAPLFPEAVSMPIDKVVKPVPTDQGEDYGPDHNPYFEFGPDDDHDPSIVGEGDTGEAESNPPAEVDYQAVLHDLDSGNLDKVRDFIENLSRGDEEAQDATQGGYDGSGIAGGLDLDEDGVFDRLETNPEDTSEEKYTYDEEAYEDAEDSFEDLQDALQDGDEEDIAEALEELQSYLGGFDKGDDEDQDATETQDDQILSDSEEDSDGDVPVEEMPKAESDPAEVDYQAVLDDLANGNIDKVKAFIENLARGEAEAQDTTGDSEHDPQDPHDGLDTDDDGIPDYMDSDSPNQTGEWVTGINGDIWVPFDKEGDDSPENPEAPDASGAAVSGPAVGAGATAGAGAAGGDPGIVGADGVIFGSVFGSGGGEAVGGVIKATDGAVKDGVVKGDDGGGEAAGGGSVVSGVVGEAGDLDENLVKDVQDFFGDIFGGGEAPAGAGAVAGTGTADKAIDGAADKAGDAIDDTLGIEGSGEVIKDIANGDFDGALETVSDSADDWVTDITGSEELGDTAGEVFDHLADGDFEEALDSAVEGIGDAAEELWDSIWD